MTQITVRPARTDEAAELSALCFRSKAHWGYDAEFLRRSSNSLTVTPELAGGGRVLVAEIAGRVAGVAAIAPMTELGAFDLERLFVEPSDFHCGAGTALLEAAASLARAEGGRKLVILADPNAVGFYERMGAARIGDAPSDSIPGRMLPLFHLDL